MGPYDVRIVSDPLRGWVEQVDSLSECNCGRECDCVLSREQEPCTKLAIRSLRYTLCLKGPT